MEIMRIVDEFGKYVGTAVVDDLKLVLKSMYAVGHVSKYPEPTCRVIRVWNDYDETGAEMLAEGFIEGWGHHKEDEPEDDISMLGVNSGSFVMGAEKEPADDMQSLVSSMDENQPDVTSPPPWEQGFEWDAAHGGWTKTHGEGPRASIEFIPNTLKLQEAHNTWQDKQDRNTR